MASQGTSQTPERQSPATPTKIKTKTKSPASSVKGSSSKTAKGKATPGQPRKLKRKVDETATPATEKASSPNPHPRLQTKDTPPKKNIEEKNPPPSESEDGEDDQSADKPGIELRDNDQQQEEYDDEPQSQPEEDEEDEEDEEEEDNEAADVQPSQQREQREEPAEDQSQASGSTTGGFFRRGGGLSKFAKGLGGGGSGGPTDQVQHAADGVKDTAKDPAGGITDGLPIDLSILKGLEVGKGGQILDKSGNPLGHVVEGDPEDLVGHVVGDDGEILDEDGDLIGRVEVIPEAAQKATKDVPDKATETVDQTKASLPKLEDLTGLSVSKGGEIKDQAGKLLGRIVEGDPDGLARQTLNEQGEILDEDGDLIGRAEVVSPVEATQILGDQVDGAQDKAGDLQNKAEETKDTLPNLTDLKGLPVSDDGQVKDKAGNVIGKVVEGDPNDLVGQAVHEKGEVVDEDGDLIGRVEAVASEEAAQPVDEQVDDAKDEVDATAGSLSPDLSILKGKKINKKGKILDEEGDVIGQIAEGYDPKALAGKIANEQGQILDKTGNVIGQVEVVPGDAADAALQSLREGIEQVGEDVQQTTDDAKESAKTAPGVEDLSILDGLEVNSDGQVLDKDGNVLGKLQDGNLDEVIGRTVNAKGLVVDDNGNIVGRVGLADAERSVGDSAEKVEVAADEARDALPELPPLSSLEGLTVNKFGKIVNDDGIPVGELVEGDPKKLSKSGARLDDKGQFWDSRGNVIGKAKTIEVEEKETEAPFAGLDELIVVKDGWVEDSNDNRVGKIVEGDAKKLVGRAVDEDGDILDKHGNVVGRAERWEQPEEPEPEPEPEPDKADFSGIAGLTPNKQGNVIGADGVPVARVAEGNLKEVAGRKIDNNGQIWNDAGKVIGRVELIPEDQRETKPEGIFGGLEGLIVNKDGLVEDEEGNIVGKVVEGDPKKLRGRAVDEDGDIIDKYGNVKGRAEPYEPPEEEVAEEDLSALEGKKVNKAGNVVDEHGVVFGRIVSGDAKKLAGKRVDGKGQIWSDAGKVIGQAELIPGAEQEKPEGSFFGFDSAIVGKDGVIVDGTGKIIGRLIEGDPKRLQGRAVDEDGDILDKHGNTLGHAERWEPEEKQRDISPMSGRKVNREGEIRDENGDVIGKVTEGDLKNLIGKTVDDNGYVVDNDGNRIGTATLLENLPEPEPEAEPEPEPEPEISPEELEKQKKAEEDKKLAQKMCAILQDTLGRIEPICKQITEHIEKADRTPKEELDEEKLVQAVKPLIEEGGRILQECNGSIRALDPDGRIAATAKARAASHEATPEEYHLADLIKELTQTVVKTIDNGRKRIDGMPHAKKKINPLWSLLSEPLFQIIAAVGLLLSGVLGLVSRLLDGLGLGGLVRGLLGGLGIDKLLEGLGLSTITESLGFKKKK